MQILLTNDDGIHAPGLAAIERALQRLGDVAVVAPATEQSGVGHSITYLTPLTAKEIFDGSRRRGWAVQGSPADCVKLGISEFCPRRPDLVVSGMNGGLNVGINVLYSGTVAAAIEGAFFGITSVAVSLEFDEHSDYDKAAGLAARIIARILKQKGTEPQLFNLNIPTSAIHEPATRAGRADGCLSIRRKIREANRSARRNYFWATNEPMPPPGETETDVSAIAKGAITLTPLHFDLTKRPVMAAMESWNWGALDKD